MLLKEIRKKGTGGKKYTLLEMAGMLGITGVGAPTTYKRVEEGKIRPSEGVIQAALTVFNGQTSHAEIMDPYLKKNKPLIRPFINRGLKARRSKDAEASA